MRLFSPPEPVVWVSPHLDDVALSCAYHLADHPGATVVTVIAGSPDIDNPPGNWHHKTTGEVYAPDSVRVRRLEDSAALAMLGARHEHLEFWDAEYVADRAQDTGAMARAISTYLADTTPAALVFNLGIHHSDHVAVSDACLSLVGAANFEIYLYAEVPYCQAFPDEVEARIAAVDGVVGTLEECRPVHASGSIKLDAARMYHSQYEALRHDEDYSFAFDDAMFADERYWKVPDSATRTGDHT